MPKKCLIKKKWNRRQILTRPYHRVLNANNLNQNNLLNWMNAFVQIQRDPVVERAALMQPRRIIQRRITTDTRESASRPQHIGMRRMRRRFTIDVPCVSEKIRSNNSEEDACDSVVSSSRMIEGNRNNSEAPTTSVLSIVDHIEQNVPDAARSIEENETGGGSTSNIIEQNISDALPPTLQIIEESQIGQGSIFDNKKQNTSDTVASIASTLQTIEENETGECSTSNNIPQNVLTSHSIEDYNQYSSDEELYFDTVDSFEDTMRSSESTPSNSQNIITDDEDDQNEKVLQPKLIRESSRSPPFLKRGRKPSTENRLLGKENKHHSLM